MKLMADEDGSMALVFHFSEKELVLSILRAVAPTNEGGKEALEQYIAEVTFLGEGNGTMQ